MERTQNIKKLKNIELRQVKCQHDWQNTRMTRFNIAHGCSDTLYRCAKCGEEKWM